MAFRGNFNDLNTSLSFSGVYRGIIEDIADPCQMGRARIRIYGIHTPKIVQDELEGIPTDQLPWAEQVAPMLGGNSGAGAFVVPLCGTVVYLFFENGDHLYPRYFGVQMGKTKPQNNDSYNPTGTAQSSMEGSPGTVSSAKGACEIAAALGIDDVCKVKAVIQVESGSLGPLYSNGEPVCRYEPHCMRKYLINHGGGVSAANAMEASYGKKACTAYDQANFVANGTSGSDHFQKMAAINRDGAIYASSFGKYQIMGFNYKACGCSSLEDFYQQMKDPDKQDVMFVNFLQNNQPSSITAMKNGDWETFARNYNGSGQVSKYASALKNAYNACKASGGDKCE